MDRKKAAINIFTSLFFKIILLVLTLLSRRFLVIELGDEANGLYSLYVSIIGFLSVAELGVGTAITFSMYKPIIDNDTKKISSLYYLFKKVYLIIGSVITIVGLIILPFLPFLAKDTTGTYNIYIGYILFLLSTVLTYFYAYKTSLINAYKNNYVTTTIRSSSQIFESLLQIFILVYFKSFELFFMSIVLSNLIQWIITNYVFKKHYRSKIIFYKHIDEDLKTEVINNTKAMFSHKIGGLLVVTLNSVIIGAFIGVIILGRYTNYITILSGVSSLLSLGFAAITSILGHSYASNPKNIFHNQFKMIYTINFIVAVVFYLGFLAIADNVISIIFSDQSIIERNIVVTLTINYFIQFMRQSTLVFKDASGTFYKDRHKPIFEGVINLTLSLILVNILGINGILIATIITNLTICHTIEPYVLHKYGFEDKPKGYYTLNYSLIAIFIGFVYIYEHFQNFYNDNKYIDLVVNGSLSIVYSMVILIICYVFIKPFRTQVHNIIKYLKNIVISLTKKNHNRKKNKGKLL